MEEQQATGVWFYYDSGWANANEKEFFKFGDELGYTAEEWEAEDENNKDLLALDFAVNNGMEYGCYAGVEDDE